jgi:hypothetical protein
VAKDLPSPFAIIRSRTKSIGRSGLSKAALPIVAQNSIYPEIVLRSA